MITVLLWILFIGGILSLFNYTNNKRNSKLANKEQQRRRKLGYSPELEKLNKLLKDCNPGPISGPIYQRMPDGRMVEYHPKPPELTTQQFNSLFEDKDK